MKKAVIFDIDGVLADKSPQRGYREYDKVDLDSPIKQGFELVQYYKFYKKYNILFISGRKELCQEKTERFLHYHYGDDRLYWSFEKRFVNFGDKLFMRGDTDHRPAEILKKEIYDNHIKDKYEIVAVFEDDPAVCKMWKQEGLFVFQPWSRELMYDM